MDEQQVRTELDQFRGELIRLFQGQGEINTAAIEGTTLDQATQEIQKSPRDEQSKGESGGESTNQSGVAEPSAFAATAAEAPDSPAPEESIIGHSDSANQAAALYRDEEFK
jgi:hypothetical protein